MQLPRILTLVCPCAVSSRGAAASLALALGASSVASAAPADEAPSWGLGIAAFSVQQPYTGIEREKRALPLISYENAYVRVFGPVVELKAHGVDLGDGQRLDLRVTGKYDFSGYKPGDAPILNGMRERKSGFWAGGKAIWRTDVVDVSVELQADVTGKSKGRRANLGLEKNWRIGQHVIFTPRVSAAWVDKKYVDYYFGVAVDEVRAGRAAYVGKSAVNIELGLRSTYVIDDRHSMFLDLGVTKLSKKIKDSPLVNRSNENRAGLGYLYSF